MIQSVPVADGVRVGVAVNQVPIGVGVAVSVPVAVGVWLGGGLCVAEGVRVGHFVGVKLGV